MSLLRFRNFVLSGIFCLLALPASAAPILNMTTSSIALSPTQTSITFSVDPNGTPLAAIVVNLSSLASGLQIVSIASLDAEIFTSGPSLGGDLAGFFGGPFALDRTLPFDLGTVTLEGFTAGTPLVAGGNFTDSTLSDIFFGPTSGATVVPEPTTSSLLCLGLLALAVRRRSRI